MYPVSLNSIYFVACILRLQEYANAAPLLPLNTVLMGIRFSALARTASQLSKRCVCLPRLCSRWSCCLPPFSASAALGVLCHGFGRGPRHVLWLPLSFLWRVCALPHWILCAGELLYQKWASSSVFPLNVGIQSFQRLSSLSFALNWNYMHRLIRHILRYHPHTFWTYDWACCSWKSITWPTACGGAEPKEMPIIKWITHQPSSTATAATGAPG